MFRRAKSFAQVLCAAVVLAPRHASAHSIDLKTVLDAYIGDPLSLWPLLVIPPGYVWWRLVRIVRAEKAALENGGIPRLLPPDAALVAGLKKINGTLVTTVIGAIFAVVFWRMSSWGMQITAADFAAWDTGHLAGRQARLGYGHDVVQLLYDLLGTEGALITLWVLFAALDLLAVAEIWQMARTIRTSTQSLYDLGRDFVWRDA